MRFPHSEQNILSFKISPLQKGQIIGNTQQQAEEGNFYFAARYLGEPVNPLDLLNGQAADPS